MNFGVLFFDVGLLKAAFEGQDSEADRVELIRIADYIAREASSMFALTVVPEEARDDITTVLDAVEESRDHLDPGDRIVDALEPMRRSETTAAMERLETTGSASSPGQ